MEAGSVPAGMRGKRTGKTLVIGALLTGYPQACLINSQAMPFWLWAIAKIDDFKPMKNKRK